MKYCIKKVADNLKLGEGCIWDEKRNKVHYLDIESYKIYSYSLEDGNIEEMDMKDYVGCIALDKYDNMISAVRNQVIYINMDTKHQEVLLQIKQPEYIRFNDGKLDQYGNLWVGTMAIDQSHPKAKNIGKLYCIKDKKIISEYSGFTIPNGLAWNHSGTIFYHIDTAKSKVDMYDVLEEGIITNKRTVLHIEEEGAPDGMCIDKKDNLWIAMWGAGKVNQYHVKNGKKISSLKLEDRYVSCCSFVGKDENILAITTARDEKGDGGNLYLAYLNT